MGDLGHGTFVRPRSLSRDLPFFAGSIFLFFQQYLDVFQTISDLHKSSKLLQGRPFPKFLGARQEFAALLCRDSLLCY